MQKNRSLQKDGPGFFHILWSVVLGCFAAVCVALFWPLCFAGTFLPIFPSRTGIENLQRRLAVSWFRAHLILSFVFLNYVSYVFEMLLLSPLGASVILNEQDAWNVVTKVTKHAQIVNAKPTGVAFLGAHFGESEALGSMMARVVRGLQLPRFRALAKPSQMPFVTKILNRVRALRGIECLWTDRRDLVRELMRAAAAGESLGFLIDQKPQFGGLFLEFFGAPAAFPAGGLDVCLRAHMPVVFTCIRRVLPGVFICYVAAENDAFDHAAAVIFDPSNKKNSPATQSVARYAHWLERHIRAHPAQWCWDYRKWSRLPALEAGKQSQAASEASEG